MSTPTVKRINDRIADRVRRGLSWESAMAHSLSESPNTREDVAAYAERLGVSVRKSWSTSKIINAVTR